VSITLAGFRASGNFTIGKMYGVPYGSFDAILHLTSSSTHNTIYVKGSIDPFRGVKLQGEADLRVAGIVAHFKVDAALTSTDQFIAAEAELSLGGTKFLLAGSFGITKTAEAGITRLPIYKYTPTSSFTAAIPNFSIFGYNLGSARIQMNQSVSSANISVALNVNIGIVRFQGNGSLHWVDDQIAFSLGGFGRIGIDQWFAALSFQMSNCGNSDCTKAGPFELTASGTVQLGGFTFNLDSLLIDGSGHFTVQTSMSNEGCYNTGNIAKLGIEFEGCFDYTVNALISDTAPYARLDANASLKVDVRVRHYPRHGSNYWGDWSRVANFSSGIGIQLSPFRLYFSTRIMGYPLSFEI
jgi:hypothetical protein